MTVVYDFRAKLEASRGSVADQDKSTLTKFFSGVQTVLTGSEAQDRRGIDYVVRFEHGGQTLVDAKGRELGCSRYWGSEPELALEVCSVVDKDGRCRKSGWTWDAGKECQYILYRFRPEDCANAWVIPFQQLRTAFLRSGRAWATEFGVKMQHSGDWESQCIFVPVSAVEDALSRVQGFRVVPRLAGRESV